MVGTTERQGGMSGTGFDVISKPKHYNQGDIECIDAMVSAFGKEKVAHFCLINAFKYVWRTDYKNGLEDVNKSIWYLKKYKELMEGLIDENN